ncbi:hypothetical protein SLH47_23885 [Cognatiyoonia sp. IB215182]|nr:hypothetical protein [Cognatiyoonia sp. IB215182]
MDFNLDSPFGLIPLQFGELYNQVSEVSGVFPTEPGYALRASFMYSCARVTANVRRLSSGSLGASANTETAHLTNPSASSRSAFFGFEFSSSGAAADILSH